MSRFHLNYEAIIRYARCGFTPIEVVRYNLDKKGDIGLFLGERDRLLLQEVTRSEVDEIIHDKLAFHCALSPVSDLVCQYHGLILGGYFVARRPNRDSATGERPLESLLEERALVVKPIKGAMKRDVLIVERRADGALTVNGSVVDATTTEVMKAHASSLVTDYAVQGSYAREITPWWSGPIRMLTIRTADRSSVAISASHQFSTLATTASPGREEGSLRAGVDIESGELGKAFRIGDDGRLESMTHHPDTSARIRGIVVPDWVSLRRRLEAAHSAIPKVESLSWDVVVTDDGPRVLEAERALSPRVYQWHQPLLANPDFAAFAARHGVAGGRKRKVRLSERS